MTLAVDLRPLGNAHSGRGIGRYVRGLMGDLISSDDVVRLTDNRAWSIPRVRSSKYEVQSTWVPRPRLRFDTLPAMAVRRRLEHMPLSGVHITDPYLVELAPRHCPWIVTVYDLIQWGHPGLVAGRFRRGIEAALKRPDSHFVAISETTASELAGLGVDRARITVLLPGPTLWPEPSVTTGFAGALVIGALDPHKRPVDALQASRRAGVPILFAGRHQPGLAERWGIMPSELRSDVDDRTLAQLIRDARAVVHASEAEGFGLPVLEALALGTPVVAYDLPVTREIVGPDYPLVPLSRGSDGLAQLVRQTESAAFRRELVHAAEPTIAMFDWNRSQGRRDAVYARVTAS